MQLEKQNQMNEAEGSSEVGEEPGEKTENSVNKYKKHPHTLFSRYDEGIQLSEVQWYSVTAEAVAYVTAKTMAKYYGVEGVIWDPFGGAGGNCIQFCHFFEKVLYGDIDEESMACAKNNFKVYEVNDQIECRLENFFDTSPDDVIDAFEEKFTRKSIHAIFMSPPWGGPEYAEERIWSLDYPEPSVFDILEHSKSFTKNICLFLPRNSSREELQSLNPKEIQYLYMHGLCKGLCVYL